MTAWRRGMEPLAGCLPLGLPCSTYCYHWASWSGAGDPFTVHRCFFPKPPGLLGFLPRAFPTASTLQMRGEARSRLGFKEGNRSPVIPREGPVISRARNKHLDDGFLEGSPQPAYGVSDKYLAFFIPLFFPFVFPDLWSAGEYQNCPGYLLLARFIF